MKQRLATTARNSLDSGFAKAQSDFDFHVELEYRRDEMRRWHNSRKRDYEPPAPPNVFDTKTADYSPRPNWRMIGPRMYVHQKRGADWIGLAMLLGGCCWVALVFFVWKRVK